MNYTDRINAALDYIGNHLHEKLTLDAIANVVAICVPVRHTNG
ncbi:MAG: hypothetical protein ACOC2Y_02805 [Spirochaetota bacterium]